MPSDSVSGRWSAPAAAGTFWSRMQSEEGRKKAALLSHAGFSSALGAADDLIRGGLGLHEIVVGGCELDRPSATQLDVGCAAAAMVDDGIYLFAGIDFEVDGTLAVGPEWDEAAYVAVGLRRPPHGISYALGAPVPDIRAVATYLRDCSTPDALLAAAKSVAGLADGVETFVEGIPYALGTSATRLPCGGATMRVLYARYRGDAWWNSLTQAELNTIIIPAVWSTYADGTFTGETAGVLRGHSNPTAVLRRTATPETGSLIDALAAGLGDRLVVVMHNLRRNGAADAADRVKQFVNNNKLVGAVTVVAEL